MAGKLKQKPHEMSSEGTIEGITEGATDMKTTTVIRGEEYTAKSKIHPTIGVSYFVWVAYPEKCVVKESDEGKQIWVAGTPKTAVFTLVKFHPIGTKMFLDGGYTIKQKGSSITRNVDMNTVILHPDNFKRKSSPIRKSLLPSLPKANNKETPKKSKK